MNVEERKILAKHLHDDLEYNCAQATALAFLDSVDCDEKTLFKSMEPFGRGMGYRGTCGALSGALAIIGLKESYGDPTVHNTKINSYGTAEKISLEFIHIIGTENCAKIKGIDTGEPLVPCPFCIDTAIELISELYKLD